MNDDCVFELWLCPATAVNIQKFKYCCDRTISSLRNFKKNQFQNPKIPKKRDGENFLAIVEMSTV